jgi:hypothetical protein
MSGSSEHGGSVVWGNSSSDTPYKANDEISAGDTVDYAIATDDQIQVTWENEEGTQSATLQNFRGPDA